MTEENGSIKICPLLITAITLAKVLYPEVDIDPLGAHRAACDCLRQECAWYVYIFERDKYAGSCSLGWLGHRAVLDVMLDKTIPNDTAKN